MFNLKSKLKTGLWTVLFLLMSALHAWAVNVTIDPQNYTGFYRVGDGNLLPFGNGQRVVDLPAGASYDITFERAGNSASFDIDAGGNLANVDTDTLTDSGGNTLTIKNTNVNFDRGAYIGRAGLSQFSQSCDLFSDCVDGSEVLVPGVEHILGMGVKNIIFDILANGDVVFPASDLDSFIVDNFTSPDPTVTFRNAPFTLDRDQFLGFANIPHLGAMCNWNCGTTTQPLVAVSGLTYNIQTGPNFLPITADTSGNFSTTTTDSLTISGSPVTDTVTLNNTIVNFENNGYQGSAFVQFGAFGSAAVITQTPSMILIPGTEWKLFYNGQDNDTFDIDATGNVTMSSSSASASGDTVSLNTSVISIDPNSYTGNWQLGGYKATNDTFFSLSLGSVSGIQNYAMLNGVDYAISISPDFGPFDLANPCGINPNPVAVGSETFNISCKTSVDVTFDPGPDYIGLYFVSGGTNFVRGVQTFELDFSSTTTVSIGDFHGARIHVDSVGNLTSDSDHISINGTTVTFNLVPVNIVVGPYEGLYGFGRAADWRSGDRTIHIPGFGTGADDFQTRHNFSIGDYHSVRLDLDASGNFLPDDSDHVDVSGNTVTINTVPVNVVVGLFDGLYGFGRASNWERFDQTLYLPKFGTGADDAQTRHIMSIGDGGYGAFLDLDASGDFVPDNSDHVDVAGNTITINTVPVNIDPQRFLGLYGFGRSSDWMQGVQTVNLSGFGSGADDRNGIHRISFGDWGANTSFQLDANQEVFSNATNVLDKIGFTGNNIFFNTFAIDINPQAFTGGWQLGRASSVLTGSQIVDLVPGRYRMGIVFQDNGKFFDVLSPCDVDPSEVAVGTDDEVFHLGCAANLLSDAGPDQTVDEGVLVTLDGSASTHPQGDALNYDWNQIGTPAVTFDLTDPARPTFTAPYLSSNTTLTFELVVNDGTQYSDPDTVEISVLNVNTPPVSDAGDDSTIKEGAVASLDGSNSFDTDSDPLTYQWTQIGGDAVTLLPDGTVVAPSFTAPVGAGDPTLVFHLEVSDGKESSAESTDQAQDAEVTITVVENSVPIANAGSDQTKSEGVLVNLDGSLSNDPDGDGLSFDWEQTTGTTVTLIASDTASPSFQAPAVSAGGEALTFELTVTDDDPVNPKSGTDTVVVNVVNANDPPRCDLAVASSEKLWPPNHKLNSVSVQGVSDPDGDQVVSLIIDSVTQDEPVNGLGDGDSSPDAVIEPGTANNGTADTTLIRSERSGNENGRVYQLNFTADDGFESCTGSVNVSVPHNRKSTAVDDGQTVDSTLQ